MQLKVRRTKLARCFQLGSPNCICENPLNTVLGNVASLNKLDLLAEVSKQQFQIAALENAKRELEMQVEHLLVSFIK
ncbi:hypothetical protein FBUS_03269 [Fasciolopsis buskii]|uniref:Uncharacterized protein n=1 Tax=Fasciolopsis buskii TaxID=27845 RepID=A0A8E0RVN5_9TREM|nr:hypothetical protein FBUS_03269 [Fasciolopsis buski]